ncbi:MAG: hypothetical protein FD167_5572 [bacterium]|nr:MAG: hypothetical protein FD167_5572 [bacterium]
MRYLLGLLMWIFLAVPAWAQTFDYGDPSELRGVAKIFVFTGSDLELRENITKNIQKKLPQLQFTSSADDAEVALVFAADVNTFIAGVNSNPNYNGGVTSTPNYRTVVNGSGLVFKSGSKNGRLRLIMQYGDSRSTIFERRPSTNFAKAFVKAYENANKEQK